MLSCDASTCNYFFFDADLIIFYAIPLMIFFFSSAFLLWSFFICIVYSSEMRDLYLMKWPFNNYNSYASNFAQFAQSYLLFNYIS